MRRRAPGTIARRLLQAPLNTRAKPCARLAAPKEGSGGRSRPVPAPEGALLPDHFPRGGAPQPPIGAPFLFH